MRIVLGLTLVCAIGCSGELAPSKPGSDATGGGGSGGATARMPTGIGDLYSAECKTAGVQPGSSPIRRLTRSEYNNTVADLLGDTTAPAKDFPAEEIGSGFHNNAGVQSISLTHVRAYETAALALATQGIPTGAVSTLLGCDPKAAAGADVCAHSFIDSFGKRAYRRALKPAESERLFQFYAASAKAYGGFEVGVRMTMEAILQSPYFWYRVEASPPDGAVRRVTGYELATRLSYLMWGSMPDEALFKAAESGALDTATGVSEQASRMLMDPKSSRSMGTFFSDWLQLDNLAGIETHRDQTMFPNFTGQIAKLLRTETELFTTDVMSKGSGDLKGLMLGSYTFMNKPLADFYGVTGPTGDAFERVELDPAKRVGVLTQGSLMASHANPNQTSPVARGFLVRDSFLCSRPPPPPANLKVMPPAFDPTVTTRQRFAMHRAQEPCKSCHQLMDPIGLSFENFDPIGRYRTEDAGQPIDVTGELFGTDVDGPFNGPVELASKLSSSAMTQGCMVKQWFRFSSGRAEDETLDGCTLDALSAAFKASNGNVRDLLVKLTQTDTFLYRTNENGAM